MSTDDSIEPSVSGKLRNAVALLGWLFYGLLFLPVVAAAVALSAYLVRYGLFGPLATPDIAGAVDDQIILLGLLALLAGIVYGLWRFGNLLQVITFGEGAVEASEDQTTSDFETLQDTSEDVKETLNRQ
jgi:small-conductance mechanosensitive channel